jgi:RNA polymerase sigma-70 factor (ECF subfamily)
LGSSSWSERAAAGVKRIASRLDVTRLDDAKVPPFGMTDGALVRRALDGDARAFSELVDRHAAACLRFATRMLDDKQDAEDAAQEAFLRAHRALARYDERSPFRTWLFTILINRCRTMMTQRMRRQRRIVVDDDALERSSVDSGRAAFELREEIDWALALLAPEQREAFLLRHVEQLSYEEMVVVTGAGVSALKMRVKRACERLQLLLAEGVIDERR